MRTCTKCRQCLPLEQFVKNKTKPEGRGTRRYPCTREDNRNSYYKNWDSRQEKGRKNRKTNPIKQLVSQAKIRAKKKGLKFSITEKDLTIPKYCPLLGIELQIHHDGTGRKPNSPSLDRIDNNFGYIPGNVWIISDRANAIKRDASIEELQLIAKNLGELHGKTRTN